MAKKPAPAPTDSRSVRSAAVSKARARMKEEAIAKRWAMARARYENDPRETFAALGRDLEVSRQSVQEKAKRDGWVKATNDGALAKAAAVAAVGADVPEPVAGAPAVDAVAAAPVEREPMPPKPEPEPKAIPPNPRRLDPPKPEELPSYGEAAAALAVRDRAEILTRHRNELRVLRGFVQEVVNDRKTPGADVKSKVLTRVVASVKAIQDAERKAWGLDVPEGDDGSAPGRLGGAAVTVLVKREGATPVYVAEDDDEDEDDDE